MGVQGGVTYRTIVADPPWAYTNGAVPSGGVDHHFGTMTNAEIAGLPVGEWAEENAHLYLWVTNPRLFPEPHDGGYGPQQIAEAWGFRYVTLLTWLKPGLGLGYYFRGCTEHVMFCVRGRAPIPPELRVANYFTGPRTAHSRKPDSFMDLVEQVSPGPYLEMFSRRARFGWETWGNQALGGTGAVSAGS
jgi:N6-adenosine-specific RNA methylase IME4